MRIKLFLFIIPFLFSCGTDTRLIGVYGYGKKIIQEYPVAEFENIVSGFYTIMIHKAENFRVTAEMPADMLKYTEIVIKDNTLHIHKVKDDDTNTALIKIDSGNYGTIDVYTPLLTGIEAQGTTKIELLDTFDTINKIIVTDAGKLQFDKNLNCPYINITVNGIGRVSGNLQSDSIELKMESLGKATIAGVAKTLNAAILETAKFDGRLLRVEAASVFVNELGDAKIWVTKSLDAKTDGYGKIYYKGTPSILNIQSKNIYKMN